MKLLLSPHLFAISRFAAHSEVPGWSLKGSFSSINKTGDELSIVCEEKNIPLGVTAERGWRLFKVQGPLDFNLTGVLVSIATPLAQSKISIFAISTFETDYILVKSEDLESAIASLKKAKFSISLTKN